MFEYVFWLIGHIIFILAKLVKNNLISNITNIIIVIIFLFLITLPPTFDLNNYLLFIKNPEEGGFEYGFYILILIVNTITFNNDFNALIALKLVVIFLTLFSIKNYLDIKINLEIIAIVFLSLYIFLATNNIIRQGLMLPLIIISGNFLIHKKYFKGLLYFLIALLIHKSAPLFLLIYLFPSYLYKSNMFRKFKYLNSISAIIFAILFALIIPHFLDSNLLELYVENNIEIGRTDHTLKFFLTLFFFLITNYFLKINLSNKYKNLINLRTFNYIFLFSLYFYPEFFSRVAVYCYFIDLFIICLFKYNSNFYRVACMIMILTYSISPQVYNILNGVYYIGNY